MKQLEVEIMGQTYLLACPEGGSNRLLEAVERVDTAMCNIRDSGKLKMRDRIAVLAALNLAFDLADRPADTNAEEQADTAPLPPQAQAQNAQAAYDEALFNSVLERLDQALDDPRYNVPD